MFYILNTQNTVRDNIVVSLTSEMLPWQTLMYPKHLEYWSEQVWCILNSKNTVRKKKHCIVNLRHTHPNKFVVSWSLELLSGTIIVL